MAKVHQKIRAHLEARLTELSSRVSEIDEDLREPGAQDFEEHATEAEGDEVLEGLGNAALEEIAQIQGRPVADGIGHLRQLHVMRAANSRRSVRGSAVRCPLHGLSRRINFAPQTPCRGELSGPCHLHTLINTGGSMRRPAGGSSPRRHDRQGTGLKTNLVAEDDPWMTAAKPILPANTNNENQVAIVVPVTIGGVRTNPSKVPIVAPPRIAGPMSAGAKRHPGGA